MLKYALLQLEEPRRGSPSVEGVAWTHWIPQLLQVHHPTLIILIIMVKIHFIKDNDNDKDSDDNGDRTK